ncbi:MAG TPA: aromatic amino acid hydroxylase [Polyangiaceae bacterium]
MGAPPASPLYEIPPHLRKFVVRQNYDEYTEEDQAVWRFVVQQTHARLLNTAHEAYAPGFEGTGISVDRIPRIDEVSERLSRFGWRAVCVDGFVPPRAFQEFQAHGILPIAADIRTSKHLTYTPAPDIIHEAAGHAPFLAEPHYAGYVRRIGEVATKAFGGPADRAVYDAIYTLSEVKEDPGSLPEEIAAAERALERALGPARTVSESVKIARLYWWTAEYGLVGTPADFRLYGAGLLSSIGEGHFARGPSVPKIPLTAACVDVDYDVTRPQPQLFVTRDFAELEEVLEAVTATLAFRVGGDRALRAAQESAELATIELDSRVLVMGTVSRIHEESGKSFLVELSGPCAVGRGGRVDAALPRPGAYALPLGALEDGTPLSALTRDTLGRHTDGRGKLALRLASGLSLHGTVRDVVAAEDRILVLVLADFEILRGRERLFRPAPESDDRGFPLALGERVHTAAAGASDGFFMPTALSEAMVPKPRRFDATGRERIALYERATTAWRERTSAGVATEFERILAHLDRAFPDEWLLRWNLLESLVKLGERADLAGRLEADLERLELRFERLEPIATGLGYVRSLRDRGDRGSPTIGGGLRDPRSAARRGQS